MNVLFVCVRNAGRSQIAEALFARAAGSRHEARSAGSAPDEAVHPEVVETLAEVGIDVSGRRPRAIDRADAEWAEVVVTMGCGDDCPVVPGARYVDWQLDDPAGRSRVEVRAIRNQIDRGVHELIAELDRELPQPATSSP